MSLQYTYRYLPFTVCVKCCVIFQNIETDTVSAALQLLTTSATRLRAECIDCPPLAGINPEYDPAQKTHQIIQYAYDIAKAAKQLVTLFQ